MKALAAALIVANLLALAWWQGWIDDWVPSSREPQRVARQVAPERLAVVPIERLDTALRRLADADRCLEVGPLDDAAFARVAYWVATLGTGARGEAIPPVYRVRLGATIERADLLARRAELAATAGREPVPCTGAAVEQKRQGAAGPPLSGGAAMQPPGTGGEFSR